MHALLKTSLAGALLSICFYAQAQSAPTESTARHTRAKTKSQEEMLLEQLNEKFLKLDELNQKYDELQQRFDALEKRSTARDAELEQARRDAADARQKLEATQQAIGPDGAAVTQLQTQVAVLKSTSDSLASRVETTQQATKKLEDADTIRFKGVELKPGGFLAAETVDRQRGIGGDVNTQFSGIPFSGQSAAQLSEFNASGRQSRISLLVEGMRSATTLRGY